MKAIEGIKLEDLSKELDVEALAAERTKIKNKIAHIKGEHSNAKGTVARCEKDLEKAKKSLAKHEEKLAKIEKGDWTALEEEKKDQGQNQKPSEE